MKKKCCILTTVLALFSSCAIECTMNITTSTGIDSIDAPVYKECGGVIPLYWDGSRFPQINYKQGSASNHNEFCVWSLLPDDSVTNVTLTFNQGSYMAMATYDGIVVYSFKDLKLTSHKIPYDTVTISIVAEKIFVAFSTNCCDDEPNGFLLNIKVTQGFDGTNRQAFYLGQNKGEFTYPEVATQENYGNNELVSVVLHGPAQTPRPSREYRLRNLDVENNYDFVDVYMLLPYHDSYAPYYKFVGRYSGNHQGFVSNSKVVTQFPVLYIFSSDRKGTGKGFTITWKLSQTQFDKTISDSYCN